ncbi:conserved protein of unknown function [Pseudorhizobium banfieldiae]|uniref:DUF86 domain-containing protein n=1 Tax=Pseudorhizobium banfieldiae TaxID=1125847 RepID=L0NHB7_9HYPH|nr:HepT-like ribonuclease domain-containing protein [Pseudorhizobium banfieldiae]CAD6615265.1 hypothetical protein RNT25_02821 [arsenite-oxidising bacterium NT-25]CCF20206.1 conserved protein of unknown function [Pseudorhizobium banfieldiae]
MTADRLAGYIAQMNEAALKASDFLSGMGYDAFAADERTQMAVGMTLVLIGDAAARIMQHYPDFPVEHPEIPWNKIKGMRNVVVHDYYELDLPVVFETVQKALPDLVIQLDALRHWRPQGE